MSIDVYNRCLQHPYNIPTYNIPTDADKMPTAYRCLNQACNMPATCLQRSYDMPTYANKMHTRCQQNGYKMPKDGYKMATDAYRFTLVGIG